MKMEKITEKPKYKTVIKEQSHNIKQIDKNAKRHSSHKKRFSLNLNAAKSSHIKSFETLINIKDDSIILNNSDDKHNITFTLNNIKFIFKI